MNQAKSVYCGVWRICFVDRKEIKGNSVQQMQRARGHRIPIYVAILLAMFAFGTDGATTVGGGRLAELAWTTQRWLVERVRRLQINSQPPV